MKEVNYDHFFSKNFLHSMLSETIYHKYQASNVYQLKDSIGILGITPL